MVVLLPIYILRSLAMNVNHSCNKQTYVICKFYINNFIVLVKLVNFFWPSM